MREKAKYLVFPILWSLLVTFLCGLPGNNFPKMDFWAILHFDSVAHAFVFGVFAVFWGIGFAKLRVYSIKTSFNIGIIWAIVYGCLIELMQWKIFVRRSAEFPDMVSDALGAIIGGIILYCIYWPLIYKAKSKQTPLTHS
ncbi:MAG: VanZ family protein [Bacteroidota bacterium]|nr:VanZ family protein [Bacteroidota bacterium]